MFETLMDRIIRPEDEKGRKNAIIDIKINEKVGFIDSRLPDLHKETATYLTTKDRDIYAFYDDFTQITRRILMIEDKLPHGQAKIDEKRMKLTKLSRIQQVLPVWMCSSPRRYNYKRS